MTDTTPLYLTLRAESDSLERQLIEYIRHSRKPSKDLILEAITPYYLPFALLEQGETADAALLRQEGWAAICALEARARLIREILQLRSVTDGDRSPLQKTQIPTPLSALPVKDAIPFSDNGHSDSDQIEGAPKDMMDIQFNF
jgi:hypothetical protein